MLIRSKLFGYKQLAGEQCKDYSGDKILHRNIPDSMRTNTTVLLVLKSYVVFAGKMIKTKS